MLRLLAIISAAIAVADANTPLPRGVPMSQSDRFADPTTFTCGSGDATKAIPFAWVNDGYCDCPGR